MIVWESLLVNNVVPWTLSQTAGVLGRAGWELAFVFQDQYGECIRAIFKRQWAADQPTKARCIERVRQQTGWGHIPCFDDGD